MAVYLFQYSLDIAIAYNLRTSHSTSPQIPLHNLRLWPNIKVKNINRQPQRRACIWYIHNTRNMSLNRSAAQQQIDLIIVVAVSSQVFDDSEASLAISDCGIQVVLFTVLID